MGVQVDSSRMCSWKWNHIGDCPLFLDPQSSSDAHDLLQSRSVTENSQWLSSPEKSLPLPSSQKCGFYQTSTTGNNFKKHFYQKYLMAKCCVFLKLYHYTGEFKTITSLPFMWLVRRLFCFYQGRELVEISFSFNRETNSSFLRRDRLI